MPNFVLEKKSGQARAGLLRTQKGVIQTPFFMPVATRAAMKGALDLETLSDMGHEICLSNTYHLFLRPGSKIIAEFGGLHNFMKWEKPILTDSGGFQVFSIQKKKITDEGVLFHSHIDGKKFFFDAEKSIEIQHDLGADIIMAFDECPPSKIASSGVGKDPQKIERKLYFKVKKAVERTTDWAERSLAFHFKKYSKILGPTERPQIFGIIQGGCFSDLRKKSLKEITNLPFDGFAMGGLAVGEPPIEMYKVLDEMADLMPVEKPRYLMGVGTPIDLIEAVSRGMDMFDCVLPARNARHGTIYTWQGPIKIKKAIYANSQEVLDPECGCPICQKGFSKGYLHHLLKVGEALAARYLTTHNLYFYKNLMETMREKILRDEFEDWKKNILLQLG